MVLERKNLVVRYEHLRPELKDAVDALRRNRRSRLAIAGASALAMGVTKPLVYGSGGIKTSLADAFGAAVAGLFISELFSSENVEAATSKVGVLVRTGNVFKDPKHSDLTERLCKRYTYFFVNGDGHLVFTNKNPFVGRKRELTR